MSSIPSTLLQDVALFFNVYGSGVFTREITRAARQFVRGGRNKYRDRDLEDRDSRDSASVAPLEERFKEFREEMRTAFANLREEVRSDNLRERGARHALEHQGHEMQLDIEGRLSHLEALAGIQHPQLPPPRDPPSVGRQKTRP